MFSLSKQWFVHMDPLAEKALLAVENKELTIIPERFEKIYNHWLTNIKDWCISRQLWWGHRIPVWYVVGKDCEEDYIVAKNAEEALEKAHEKYGKDVEIYQDPDVLDTWFSRFVLLITKIQACLANFDSSAKARRANQHINHLWRAQSDISNAQNESAAPHKQKLIASELSASSSSNLERFLEFVTPSVPVQYLSKTSLRERRANDVFDEHVPYFVLGDVYGTH